MKQKSLITFTYIFFVLIFFAQKISFFTGTLGDQVVMNTIELFQDKQLAEKQKTVFLIFKLLNYSVYLGMVIFGYKYLFPKITTLKKWSLSIPITFLFSVGAGIILSLIDKTINQSFYISPYSIKSSSLSMSMYQHLIVRNSIEVFNALSISVLIIKVEELFVSINESRIKPTWANCLSLWLVHFTICLLVALWVNAGPTAGLILSLTPQMALLAILMTLSSLLFISIFLYDNKVNYDNLIGRISSFIFPSLGIMSIVMFAYDHRFTFGDRYLTAGWQVAVIITIVFSFLVALVTILFYRFNLSNIKANLLLQQNVETKKTELSLLKSQINPHFLFNSLNTVYGLALEEQSPKAAEGVQKLSDMMRFMLRENTAQRIPLAREIKYINDYIEFQRLRIADRENIQLDINISDGCKGEVAPMLLIPMIENAFKHGLSLDKPSWVNINLRCQENEVHLNIQNSLHQKKSRNSEESGIGLENVRQRLKILYPEKHLFQLFESTEHFEANIKVTLS